MIDVEADVFDAVARAVLATYPNAFVSNEQVEVPACFPAVSVVETVNSEDGSMADSSGSEVAVNLTYTVNVYSNSEGARAQCKAIVAAVSDAMRKLNFRRTMAQPIANAADPSIHRVVAQFIGKADSNHFYRR